MSATSELLTLLHGTSGRRDVAYAKGETIFQPTSDQDLLYVIISGYVKAYTIDQQGEVNISVIYSTGDVFPLNWLIDNPNSLAFFDAMTDCRIATVPVTTMNKLISENVTFAKALLRQVTKQFATYTARVNNLSYKYGRERLAYRLLLLAYRFGKPLESGAIQLPPFSQQDIGATINMSRESVNRELTRFEQLGMVCREYGRVTILKPGLLREEVGSDADHLYFDDPVEWKDANLQKSSSRSS